MKLSPQSQRFFTGLLLGLILVTTIGAFIPLLAQPTTDEVAHHTQVQALAMNTIKSGDRASHNATVLSQANPLPGDLDGYWATDCITELARRGAVVINDLQSPPPPNVELLDLARFYPNEPATWGVVTTMLNRSFPTEAAYGGASAIETALGLSSPVNVLYTYPADYYEPGRAITRGEAVTAIAAKAQLPYVARAQELLEASLEDGDRVPPYALEGTAAMLAEGALVNAENPQLASSFAPISRGEVAALICRASSDEPLKATIDSTQVAFPAELSTQAEPDQEVRGVWLTNIDSEVLFSYEELAAGIQRLKAMNINTLYPVVWNMGYTQYPSAVAERYLGRERRLWPGENPAFETAQGDRDMLQELIELAHAEDMAVIPWFEFGFMAPGDYELHETHPEWFAQRRDGTKDIPMGNEVFTWMNPFHPQTRSLLLQLIGEVLDNYDVEGIQVDDHLGLPVDMGYDPYTVALYEQEHGGTTPPANENDAVWMRWRADKITEFMSEVRSVIDRRQPGALLSVSPNPYPFSYAKYLQDWPTWDADGLLDEIIVQIYRNDVDRFVWELNKPATAAARKRTPTSIGLLSGLKNRPTDIDLLTEQLEAVRDRGFAGVSYFFYQSLWAPGQETMAEREQQFQASFSQTVARP
ncbi:MAG: family 10 glycosylhydrolase [Leptolyngbya sp. SIOISBB]|nr:family 10 glycosylhydrolase [Leptolyngbya sp. SIOISBB]